MEVVCEDECEDVDFGGNAMRLNWSACIQRGLDWSELWAVEVRVGLKCLCNTPYPIQVLTIATAYLLSRYFKCYYSWTLSSSQKLIHQASKAGLTFGCDIDSNSFG